MVTMKRTSIHLFAPLLALLVAALGACDPSGNDQEDLCGNEIIDPGEDCDGSDLGGMSCEELGQYPGELACTDDCSFDVSGCGGFCGDGEKNGPEECDGEDLGGMSCEDFGYYEGELGCAEDCYFDVSGCVGFCGDDVRNGPEECDGEDLAGLSCEDFGYYEGELGCAEDCYFDVSGCGGFCGDDVRNGPEECDGEDLGGATCTDLGFYRGELACTEDCAIDGSDCEGYCGDGIVDEDFDEVCDDGVNDGVYGCMPDCGSFASAYCGDGEINGPEECDGEQLGEASCESLGFDGGALSCGEDCLFDTSGCFREFVCGGVLTDERDGGEYPTVELGGLCWMAANLDVGVRIDTSLQQHDPDLIEKYCYADDPDNCAVEGGLYQWDQAMAYQNSPGARGICPGGWWLPTDQEWKDLEIYLGMSQEDADSDNWRGAPVGTSLKEGGDSGFAAPMGGMVVPSGASFNRPSFGYYWTSSLGSVHPWRRCLTVGPTYPPETVGRWQSWGRSYALSIRCVTETSQD